MATIPPNTQVVFNKKACTKLRFPPPSPVGVVVVHPGALRAASSATLAAVFEKSGSVRWVGAVDEWMVAALENIPQTDDRRAAIHSLLPSPPCSRLDVVYPGTMLRPGFGHIETTIPKYDRPWVVLGTLENGDSLGAPLNSARGRVMWFHPVIEPPELSLGGGKLSQVKLAQLWSFPPREPVGEVIGDAAKRVCLAARHYYSPTGPQG